MPKMSVIRRVGGLEAQSVVLQYLITVIRRVGGLEGNSITPSLNPGVIRRVGGLEVHPPQGGPLAKLSAV